MVATLDNERAKQKWKAGLITDKILGKFKHVHDTVTKKQLKKKLRACLFTST